MKITFIYPDLFKHYDGVWTGQYYRALALLSAVLKESGHQTSLIHLFSFPEKNSFLSKIEQHKPDLIGFSSTSHMFPLVKMLSTWIRENNNNTPIICGGVHPTLAPDQTIEHPAIDMVCVGEGEGALVELCDNISNNNDITNIANIWVKKDNHIYRNSPRPLVEDLDSLPIPDIGLFDYKNLTQEKEGYGSVSVSRGCPYNCTYCCNHALKKVYPNRSKYVRRSSVNKVLAEIKYITSQNKFIDKIIFEDDILFIKKDWAKEFVEKYRSEVGLPFECQERVNCVDEEMVTLLKEAGCKIVKFGLESGNEHVREKLLKRKMSQESIKEAVSLVKKHGMKSFTYNIIGLPFETPAQMIETIKLNAEMNVDHIQHTTFYPYPNTELYDLCLKEGFITGEESLSYFDDSTLKFDTVSQQQIKLFHRYFNLIFKIYKMMYHRSSSRKFVKLIDNFLASKIFPVFCNIFLNFIHSFYLKFNSPVKKLLFIKQRGW